MSTTQSQPNILFIFSDQQRWDTLGCYGQPLDVTPNLDAMAAEGVKFEHAFTCQPVCGPARACLQTGKYATELGCFRNNLALPLKEKTLAHYLKEAGYETGYIGKWHLASQGKCLDVPDIEQDDIEEFDYKHRAIPAERRGGYEHWIASDVLEFTSHGYNGHLFNSDMETVEFTGYRVDALTDFALDFLRTRTGEKPFFLFLSYIEPHHQNDHHRYEGPEGSQERFSNFTPPGDLAALEGDWEKEFPDYLGCCASLDQNVGRLRAELERLGIADNTLVIYTSDHGSHFRTRNKHLETGNYDDYKRTCHEAAIRLPLIISGPGFQGGKTVQDLVSLIDYPPTILEAAGVPLPEVMQGRPLQDLAAGQASDWPEDVFLQISESQVGRAVRTARWKYAVRAPGKSGNIVAASDVYVEEYLYDLENDPCELHNLVGDPELVEIRRGLAARLIQHMRQIGETVPEICPSNAQANPALLT